jgi:hypothetical protein
MHPVRGPLTLDCDVLTEDGGHLRRMLYTADRGSDSERRLRPLATAHRAG